MDVNNNSNNEFIEIGRCLAKIDLIRKSAIAGLPQSILSAIAQLLWSICPKNV